VKHNVLVVDDSRSSLLLLERILEDLGHNIITAATGEEALELLQAHDFSVVLLDVRLPGISGYEVAQRMQQSDSGEDIPIIFVTAYADQESQVFDGYSAGGVDYLLKPVDPAIVRAKVQIFCKMQEKEKQIEAHLHRIEDQKKQLERQLDDMRGLEDARMESEIRYRSLVTLSPQAIVVQVNDALVFYNTSAIQMLGCIGETAMHGRPFHTFVSFEDRDRVEEWLEMIARRGGRSEPLECTLQTYDAEQVTRHVELHACCILYDNDVGVQMAIQDITEHKAMEEKLLHLAQVDGLTGLWNRRYFDVQLDKEWRRIGRTEASLSLLMIDLDKFKPYNDTYGHLIGDACLRAVATAMPSVCHRPADIVARYGGEEFVVILPNTDAKGARYLGCGLVAAIYDLKIPHEANPSIGFVTISCGVATVTPIEGTDPGSLIEMADKALYVAKKAGGNDAYCDVDGEFVRCETTTTALPE
tara:strand:- start:36 stop:1451 length:1416 start_codon:yes stop_codon:yes gene_type:complete